MYTKIINKMYFILKENIIDLYKTINSRNVNRKRFPGVHIQKGAMIKGKKNIEIGKNTVIESGAIISSEYGGKVTIGENCVVRRGVIISTHGGSICIGNNCGFNQYTVVYGHGGLTIGDDVWFAVHCVVVPANHTFRKRDIPIYEQPISKEGIRIGDDIWVGAGVKILDGVTVGDGAVIGAGSVVSDNIPEFSVNAGIPAKVIKLR